MANGLSNGASTSIRNGVAVAKDIFALMRDSSLFGVAVLLLFFPTTFNSILTNAGFEQGSFAGLIWKRQFFDTDASLRSAHETITSLQSKNADLLKALAVANAHDGDPQQKEAYARLQQDAQSAAEMAKQVQSSVSSTLAKNEPLIEKARIAIASDAVPSPAFCYQEDRLRPGNDRYSVHCHATLASCEAARGPNPRTKQSTCNQISLSGVGWAPRHPGFMGSWYEFRSEPFSDPFPQL
jgi:hypothetical protein